MSSPISPSHYDWTELYPILNHVNCPQILSPKSNPEHLPPLTSQVRFLDIGCGYGGLLMSLGPLFPQTLMLGMEIRKKVSDFVHEKVLALRQDGSLVEARDENQTLLEKKATDLVKLQTQKVHSNSTSFSSPNNTSATSQLTPSNPSSLTYSNIESSVEHSGCLPIEKSPHHFQNIAVMRMNAMKFLPNYFEKGQCRIITHQLLSEYAYLLAPHTTSRLYTCTDVYDLHVWMVKYCDEHPSFRRLSDEELVGDPCVEACKMKTEEGKKVERNSGDKFLAIYERVVDPIELT